MACVGTVVPPRQPSKDLPMSKSSSEESKRCGSKESASSIASGESAFLPIASRASRHMAPALLHPPEQGDVPRRRSSPGIEPGTGSTISTAFSLPIPSRQCSGESFPGVGDEKRLSMVSLCSGLSLPISSRTSIGDEQAIPSPSGQSSYADGISLSSLSRAPSAASSLGYSSKRTSRPILRAMKSMPPTVGELDQDWAHDSPVPKKSTATASLNLQYKRFILKHGLERSIHRKYEFGKLLGEGATGSTWEAWPKEVGPNSPRPRRSPEGRTPEGRRAIKKIAKHCVPEHARRGLMAEVDTLRKLDHPNICKLYEVFEDRLAIYLVIDLCEGGELFDRIVEDDLLEHQACKYVRQIVTALRYCHETHGIIHRDIKPENVLFVSTDEDSPIKLIDFGIACHFKDLNLERRGTEAYEAPEVLKGGAPSPKCDTWSLGALLYIMLSGCMPFRTVADAAATRYSFDHKDWDGVSSLAKDLVTKLLVADPDKRLSTAQVLEHPWLQVRSEVSVPGSLCERLKRWRSHSGVRKILLTVFARHLDTNDLPEMYEAFLSMDSDGDGVLSFEELAAGISEMGSKKELAAGISEMGSKKDMEQVRKLFEAIDIDGSGSIDYSEFLAAAIDRKLFFREDLCMQVFQTLDRDGSGTISAQELQALLHDANIVDFLGSELREECQALLDSYDSDGDGVLDFREFTAMLTQHRVVELKRKGLRKVMSRGRSRMRTESELNLSLSE